ncbi:MAG: ATP-binding protein [Thermoleophilaceae bacterium]|nr:ATP-binding protein [Thermoleophilaceae bacterium]
MAEQWICPKCNGSTWLPGEGGDAVPCECRDRRINSAKTHGLVSTIPDRYLGLTIDPKLQAITNYGRPLEFPPDVSRWVQRYCRDISKHLAKGEGLWLDGDVGTGKTTLAMLISKTAKEQGHSVIVYEAPKLLTRIRHTYGDNANMSYDELFERLTSVELLHIEDLGAEQKTEWVLEQLYSIVNERYERGLSMIVTTNLDQSELMAQIGQRTVSRLAQMCKYLSLHGPDRRMPNKHGEGVEAAAIEIAASVLSQPESR